ncbi:glycosyltransferase family 2 protein [Rivibacter subsaxonicus]|uniref:GT2 family glycosyltransferase n=1 Tax=Rivibacter subsaxonicus TaxID=457575 RepID=A0A4Q7VMT6_9BURK|nr:glycosyltransferase family 2 protein [Rivibacter subsaxonicus]RZT97612.1 GT2 family glycosyltransferase [Rivibacter subsaxonicus]
MSDALQAAPTATGQGLPEAGWLARLQAQLRWRVGPETLRPAHQIEPLGDEPSGYRSTGTDPHFRLDGLLAAGWYMLELKMRLPRARAQAKLYLDCGSGESEALSAPLPLRWGRMAKRIVHVPAPARLRFDPLDEAGEFAIQHFALKRVSAAFAHGRIAAKLRDNDRRYADDATPAPTEPLQRWRHYQHVFERRDHAEANYAEWIEQCEKPALPSRAEQQAEQASWAWRPGFSILTPTYNTDPDHLRACLDSVIAQSYPHWELCVADDASTDPQVREILAEYAARDARVRLLLRPVNGHIVEATNSALAMAGHEFAVLLDHDDLLPSHALHMVARALQHRPSAQLVYSDEDKLSPAGERCNPYFKPDFAPDLLYAQNYVSHLGVYRRTLLERIGGFRKGYEGSQDYDLVLRCVAQIADPADVLHVPQVLYHWRMAEQSTAHGGHNAKPYATEAARRALQDHFDALGRGVRTSVIAPGLYRQHWPIPQAEPLVSLIVPTRDGHDILRNCIESILEKTSYRQFEILIVDNQSSCAQTLAYMEQLASEHPDRIRVLRYDRPFNYSAINNFAARHARGEVLGLINNDVEVISPGWLGEMVGHALRPEIGCVGAMLYYPDDTIQHAGVVIGMGGVAGHAFKTQPRGSRGYFDRLLVSHNVSAVTGAVLLLRRAVFEQLGGLDEAGLTVAFNDVDLCLKAQAAGLRNLWTPWAELYHHESKSRGDDFAPAKRARFEAECALMEARWATAILHDPCYSPHHVREESGFVLAAPAATSQAAALQPQEHPVPEPA